MMNEFDIKIGKITKEQLVNKKTTMVKKVQGSVSTIADTISSPEPDSPGKSPTFE